MLTFHVLEDQALRNRSDQLFLIFEERQWTYAQFFDSVTRVGNWMIQELGIQRGDIIALNGGNSPEYLIVWYALEGIGALPSFVNNNLTGKSLLHCIEVGPSSLICPLSLVNPMDRSATASTFSVTAKIRQMLVLRRMI
jgi:acyl-coenzyme A synthetase/AMP-(fatty) acid ligase